MRVQTHTKLKKTKKLQSKDTIERKSIMSLVETSRLNLKIVQNLKHSFTFEFVVLFSIKYFVSSKRREEYTVMQIEQQNAYSQRKKPIQTESAMVLKNSTTASNVYNTSPYTSHRLE